MQVPDDVVRAMRLATLQRFAARQQRHAAVSSSPSQSGSASAPPKVSTSAARSEPGSRRPSRAMTRLDFGGSCDAATAAVDTYRKDEQHARQNCASEAGINDAAAMLASRDGDWRLLDGRSAHSGLPQTPVRAAAAARAHGIQPELLALATLHAATCGSTLQRGRAPVVRHGSLREPRLHGRP